jgi:Type I restriction modification DNA specificity domain
MPPRLFQLQSLGQVSQGIPVGRYANPQGDSYPMITATNLEELYIKEAQSHTRLSIPDAGRYQLRYNDVVIAIRGSLLKSSVVSQSVEGSVSNQNTVFFRSQAKAINPLYLAALLRSEYFGQLPFVRERQSTTNLPTLKIADLRKLEIPLPDVQTQHEIAELFLALEQVKKVTLSMLEIRQTLANTALAQALGVE